MQLLNILSVLSEHYYHEFNHANLMFDGLDVQLLS